MRIQPILPAVVLCVLFGALICTSSALHAQSDASFRIPLRGRSFVPAAGIAPAGIDSLNRSATGGRLLFLIQFQSIPSPSTVKKLGAAGIQLQEYLQGFAYSALASAPLDATNLQQAGIRWVGPLTPSMKTAPGLLAGIYPAWSLVKPGSIDCWISFPKTLQAGMVITELKQRGIDITDQKYSAYRIIGIRIATGRLAEVASLPFIEYLQAVPHQDQALNDHSTANSRGNVLKNTSGLNLSGAGVVIGVGDNNDPLQHADLAARIINHSPNIGQAHGMHVMGTAAGAGIIREKQAGFSPQAMVIAQALSNIILYAPQYVQDHGMVITNNSYGNVVDDCATFGIYDLYSRVIDQQAFQLQNLQHVFAAGNSGTYSCAPYPAGFSNVLGAYQSSKNAVIVANGTELGAIFSASSKGPVRDGRIKPEITAQGTNVLSCLPVNSYYYNTGTSMSSPAVAGGLGLLYQRYRQVNGGTDPLNGLMKAVLLNGADDRGNPGPDYTFGFGWMNLVRSERIITQHNYFINTVAPAAVNTHSLTIPAGAQIAQLKVMLYWNDSAASAFAAHALVNDLDLEVNDPSSIVHLPYLLDTIPANVNNNAGTGADHFNNAEQVVIANPIAGIYTFNIKGTAIPFGSGMQYYLVYDTIPVSARLTFPVGGEHLATGEAVYLSWDAYGNAASSFTLQYSADNGTTWSDINTSIAPGSRQFTWTTPTTASNQARIKLIQNSSGIESVSDAFTILGVPVASLAATQCPGYVNLSWTAVPGASDYEVMRLQGATMIPLAVVPGLSYAIGGLSTDSTYLLSVRARISGIAGRRADAISRRPNAGTCAGTISDNDLQLNSILSPLGSGRILTSTSLAAETPIRVRITNLDDAATTGDIDVAWQLNAGAVVHEIIASPNIAAGSSLDYTFTSTADLAAIGSYDLVFSATRAGDLVSANDTIRNTYRQLDNQPVDLTTALTESFETMPAVTTMNTRVGLAGADHFDFNTNTIYGRVRSFVTTGLAPGGNRALTLDADRYNGGGTADTLTATYNLATYDVLNDDVRLDFRYKNHGQSPNAANRLWIRGSDTQPWVVAYDLYANQGDVGVAIKSPSIEVSDLLTASGETLGTSFQARWGQWGQHLTADNLEAAGYTFDDISVYRVLNDVQLISIDSPVVSSCNLGPAVPVRISVRNSANGAISSIPVSYQVDGGAIVTENISSIAGNATVSYTFTSTADISALGQHQVRVWTSLPSDSYSLNDTAILNITNSPVIASFPYLEDFEAGPGSWYPGGKSASWQYGTPASLKINRAASGIKAWKTSLAGSYNDGEFSYLYSPCFNITGMSNPTLSLSIALDLEDCGASLCDAAYAEYSTDGSTWLRLGTQGAGTNWYNRNYAGNQVWSVQNYTRWHVATIPLPTSGDVSRLRVRFVIESDPYVSREGMGIDDIHVYDNINGIYTGPPANSSSINVSSVNGTGWINFTDGGRLIASVNPLGQDLGSTDAQAFIHSGAIRTSSMQYYHDRDITIKPTNTSLTDSVRVRFYFTDAETELLLNATGCPGCSKPASAYDLGVSKYSDNSDVNENGDLTDDATGTWLFIPPSAVRKVPFDKGYYAEFMVKDFSEFWLNNGGPGQNQSLPVQLISFTATKTADRKDVAVNWETAGEQGADKYVIELARTNAGFSQNDFSSLGEVQAAGNSSVAQRYQFIDRETGKNSVRYYRLRMVDRDGRFTYSPIRPVIFKEEIAWQVYPNPSDGLFNLVFQVSSDVPVTMSLHDVSGRLVRRSDIPATGFVQKYALDLRDGSYSPGIYLLELSAGGRKQVFRLMKR